MLFCLQVHCRGARSPASTDEGTQCRDHSWTRTTNGHLDTSRRPPRRRSSAPGCPHRRRRAVPAGPGPQPRRADAPRRRVVHAVAPASSSRSSVRAAPARRRCWRRSPASPRRPSGSVRFDGDRPVRQPGDVPQRARLRAAGRHHPCRSAARNACSATPRGCGSRRRRPPAEVDDAVRDAIDAVGLTEHADVRVGSLERRAAQARQHRRRAAHRSARLLPRRADIGPRPGHERGADRPPAPARRPVGDGRVHHALGRGPRPVRSHRVHGARWASGLRRHRRRGARAVRGQLGPGALPPPRRPGRHHRRNGHGRHRGGARRRSPRRDQATSGERAHAVACPHPPDARDTRAQPLDARDPARVTGAGRRHVRHPLPARRVRLPAPEPELDGDDRLLGRLRRLLLRAHLRLAADLHRANDPAPRAPRRPAARRVRGVEGDRPRAVPRSSWSWQCWVCFACLDRLPSRPLSTYASIGVGLLLCAVAALGLGLLTSATVGNVAQATLALPMLCFPAVLFSGAILPVNLMAGAGAALSAVIPSRWAFEAIGHDLGARRILAQGGSPTRASAARVVRRRGHSLHRHLLAHPRSVRGRVPGRHLGCARAQHTEIDPLTASTLSATRRMNHMMTDSSIEIDASARSRLGRLRRGGTLAGVDGIGPADRAPSTAPASRSGTASRSSSRVCRNSRGR